MKQRIIDIFAMHKNDDLLRIGSKEENIDFSKCDVHIQVYFDEHLFRDEYLKLAVYSQPQKTVYQIQIPENVGKAKIVLQTTDNEDLELIDYGFSQKRFN